MSAEGTGEIIIKGGSCEIYFDNAVFEKDQNDPRRRVHKYDSHKIKRIAISGDESFERDFPNGFTGEIRIKYEP